jgi:hypothetical protein
MIVAKEECGTYSEIVARLSMNDDVSNNVNAITTKE